MTNLPPPPSCAGTYEPGHTTCDGIPGATDWKEAVPCAWRDHCVGLQTYCAERGHQPATVMATLKNFETLVGLCDAQIVKLGIKDGKVAQPKEQQTPASPTPPPAAVPPPPEPKDVLEIAKAQATIDAAKAKRSASRRRRVQVTKAEIPTQPEPTVVTDQTPVTPRYDATGSIELGLLQHLDEAFRQAFTGHAIGRPKRVTVTPGTFYSVKRGDTVKWQLVTEQGRDLTVLAAKVDLSSQTLEMQFPVTPDKLASETGVTLRPVNKRGGRMRSACHGVGRAELQTVCTALRALHDKGEL